MELFKKKAKSIRWQMPPDRESMLKDDEAKFIYEHAEKHLKKTLDINTIIISRATSLITLISGVLIFLVGYGINRFVTCTTWCNTAVFTTTAICCFYLFGIECLLFFNIKSRTYHQIGNEPIALMDDYFFKADPAFNRLKSFYITEIDNYQNGIVLNKQTNEKRWRVFNTALGLVLLTPLFFLVTWIICNHFIH